MPSTTVDMSEVKTNLSRLLERAAAGEEIVIAKAGKPLARLVSLEAVHVPRRPGAWKGRMWIEEEFDDPLPEEVRRAFEGEKDEAA